MRSLTFRLRAAALVLPMLCVATAACDIAMADLKEKETAEWRKTYELQPGGRLEIGNVNGKIDVRPGTGNTVEVVAEKISQGATKEAAREALARIEIHEAEVSPSSVKIETKIQRGSSGIFGGNNLQVQYSVRVPSNIEVHVATINGGVDINGVTGKVFAEATNGGIRGREIAGAVEASTTNGGVDMELTRVDSGIKLETTNGGIKLRLPPDAKASISARIVNGGIDTEGLTIETTGENSRRRLEGQLNGGGPRIQLEGTNGGILIRPR